MLQIHCLRRQCPGAERLRHHAIDHQLQIDVIVGQVDEIVGRKLRVKFLFEHQGVIQSGAECDDRPRIAKDCVPYSLVRLRQVLMREHEIEMVLA
jgi:hypothetical protein